MKSTKKLTLSACLSALGVVIMALGAVVDVVDLTVCALASLIIAFVYIEIGASYAFGTYLSTSLLTLILLPSKLVFFEYFLVFGVYPLLKVLIEKLPRWLWLIVKLVFINAIIWIIIFISEVLLGVPFIEGDTLVFKILFFLLLNATFVVYDIFIGVMKRVYVNRFRQKIKGLLK